MPEQPPCSTDIRKPQFSLSSIFMDFLILSEARGVTEIAAAVNSFNSFSLVLMVYSHSFDSVFSEGAGVG